MVHHEDLRIYVVDDYMNAKSLHHLSQKAAVAEVISKLVSNLKFSDLIRNKINMEVDTGALDQEIENYEKQLR